MLRYICIDKHLKLIKMNKLMISSIIGALVLMISFPLTAISQEKQEKKVKVKTVKVVDGKKIVKDTTFTVKEGEDEKEIIKTMSWVSDKDSTGTITIDLEMDSEDGHHGHKDVFILKSGKDDDLFWTEGHGGKKHKYVFKTDKHKDCEHDLKHIYEFDFEFDEGTLDELRAKLEDHKEELHNMRIKLDDEKLIMLKELDGEKLIILNELNELKELKELKELQHLDEIIELEHLHNLKELKNVDIVIPEIPEIAFYPDHNEFYFDKHHSHDNVSDKELRDAGIKNKIDKLEANDYDITIDDGVIGLSFTLASEGTPKVTVFNYFGDKVFSGKPELMNGKYSIRIDLSAKQNGVYYLMVTQKNSSFTKKLRLH